MAKPKSLTLVPADPPAAAADDTAPSAAPPTIDPPDISAPDTDDDATPDNGWLKAPGYSVDELRGVVTWTAGGVEKRIAPAPINISAVGTDESGTHFVELRWLHGQTGHRVIRPRLEIAGTRLTGLAALGAPVTGATCSALQQFLQAQEHEHWAALPKLNIFTRQGWTPDCGSFVLGRRIIGGSGEVLGAFDLAECLVERGSLDEYLALIRRILPKSLAVQMAWSAGYVPPLLRLLKERSWLLSIHGPSGHGKTAVQSLALSPWGNPAKLMITGDTTPTALEGHLARGRDGVCCIDDTQQSQSRKLVSNLAYQIAGGVGKARGDMTGAIRPLATWLTLGFVSGEHPLLRPETPAGYRNRMLELEVRPMQSSPEARELHVALSRNHGLTGPLFIEALLHEVVRVDGGVTELVTKSEDLCREFGGDEAARHVGHLVIAHELARRWVLGEEVESSRSQAYAMGKAVIGRVRQGTG